ncbi:MAG: FHA domain-containing protein, partial [Myxococcota bacterium]
MPALYRLVLTVTSGPDAGRVCVVDRDVVTVGKLPECDLVLTDPTVSRRHLRIARTPPDGWRL